MYEQYAEVIRLHFSDGAGRSDMAHYFQVDKTVATRHLEKCVQKNLLVKVYTWVRDNSRGWVYMLPPTVVSEHETSEELPF